jgi:hypothetical protein
MPQRLITCRADVQSFPFERLFSKPSVGFSKMSPSPFDYKTHVSKAAALAAFDSDASNSLSTRKPILQPSFSNAAGESEILLCNGAVNGRGDVYFDAIIQATHREDFGSVYRTVRGAIEQTEAAQFVRDATAKIIATSGVKNTLFSLQFIKGDDTWYPMDFQYRFDYFNRYAFVQHGLEHPFNVLRFAFDVIDSVDTVVTDIYVMRAISIGADKDAAFVKEKMGNFSIVYVNHAQPGRKRIFICKGATQQDALDTMDSFEREIQ